MSLTFASNLTKMIDAGLGGEVIAPDTSVAIGYRMQYNRVSGPVASWNDPVGGLPINIAAEFGAIQAGTGDPSPENVRPISGRTEVTVTLTGKNIMPLPVIQGGIDSNGRNAQSNTRLRSQYFAIKGGATYTASVEQGKKVVAIHFYTEDVEAAWIRRVTNDSGTATFTAPINANYIRLTFAYNDTSTTIVPSDLTSPQVEVGAVATAYEPYKPIQSVTVQLGETVYGGSLDVTTGVMTVEWANIASYDGETLPGEWISDRDVYSPGATPTTGAQVCYKLAEPLTVQLSPQTINSLLGQNNVWSDAGDVSVTWKEKLYTEGY